IKREEVADVLLLIHLQSYQPPPSFASHFFRRSSRHFFAPQQNLLCCYRADAAMVIGLEGMQQSLLADNGIRLSC
ncbi:MAG: hypothetical protein ACYCOU_25980, partial [Sulfobacillus sp.]